MTEAVAGTSTEQTILAIEQDIYDAICHKDAERFGGHLAEDFVYRKADGSETLREEFLRNIAALPVDILSVRGEHEKVSVYGDVAVLTGVQHAAYRQQDAEGVSSSAFADVFVRRDGRWLLVLGYEMSLDG